MGFHSFFQHEFVEQDPKYSLSKGQQVHLCAFQFTRVSTEDNNTCYQVDIKLKEGEDMKTWHILMSLNMLPHPPVSTVTVVGRAVPLGMENQCLNADIRGLDSAGHPAYV